MMKLILIAILAMTDAQAAINSVKTWGSFGRVAKIRTGSSPQWIRQVGFVSPGCALEFNVLGSDPSSWDRAYAAVPADKGVLGVVGQLADIHIVGDASLAGTISSAQMFLDGKLYGDPQRVMAPAPWNVTVPFDTTKVANGLHVQCARLFHLDGSYTMTKAVLLNVQQPLAHILNPAAPAPLFIPGGPVPIPSA
jgi:hypothetical protein